jgi:NAD(P)H-hydrate epimerase
MILVTPNQMKMLEATANSDGTSYEQLMLNAGKTLADEIVLKADSDSNILFLCGNGNNAGDCFVAGRILIENGFENVAIALLCGSPKTELANKTFDEIPEEVKVLTILEDIKECFTNSDVICDGIFGTGFHGELPKEVQKLLSMPTKAYKIAVDIPSGVDCKTGTVSNGTLHADETITFAYDKLGMAVYPACEYCGEVKVADIGITANHYDTCIEDRVQSLTADTVRLPYRSDLGNKGTFGRVLHVTGSKNMVGACIMAGKSALRCGVGLVTICTKNPELLPITMPEPTYISRDFYDIFETLEKSTALLIGCGLGTAEKSVELFRYVVKYAECPLIIDADGINILSNCIDIIDNKKVILTPHPLEMSRLAKVPVKEVQSNRLGVATEFAKKHKCVVVLKGANTIVTDGKRSFVDTVANSGMSKGGSGDVLAGMVSSFVAQGMDLFEASKLSVYIHSQCGLNCADRLSKYAMLPTDVIEEIPNVIKTLAKER